MIIFPIHMVDLCFTDDIFVVRAVSDRCCIDFRTFVVVVAVVDKSDDDTLILFFIVYG